MDVITVASRKGGAGKTTLCAHLAAHAHLQGRRCLILDADPQGSLALCNSMRGKAALPFASADRGIARALALAAANGIEWVFIDTAPSMWVVVQEAIRLSTLVLVPARPGFLDLAAVRETVKTARACDKPYAVVLNACPVKRDEKEAPVVAQSRFYLDKHGIPVWAGQISLRAAFALTLANGASVVEADARSLAAAEIGKLWGAVEKSIAAIHDAHAKAAAHGQAA
jgi:cellulose biosynthesis protein BcsQ